MRDVARRFSRAAQTYEQGAALHRHVAARLAGLMPDPETVGASRLLEVGCGTGVLSERLLQRYPNATLCMLDSASAMVDCVRERWQGVRGVEAVVADLRDYRAGSPYNWVFSSSALHWIVPLVDAFTSIVANLAPQGGVCAAMMVEGTLGELHALRRRVSPGKVPGGCLPEPGDVVSSLGAAGLTLVASELESIRARYHSADDFLRTLHAQGLTGGGVSRADAPLSRHELDRLRSDYDETCSEGGQGVYATFVVQYFMAVKSPRSSGSPAAQ